MIEGRVYGSPTSGRMTGWKRNPDAKGLKMVDVPVTSKKKNIADFRLVVDAMELLCTGKLDALCIGSSDGDFSALATKIKERSLPVYGFGVKQTPEIYKNICDDFFDCANLRPVKDTTTKPQLKLIQRPRPRRTGRRRAAGAQSTTEATAAVGQCCFSGIPMHIAQAVRKVVRAHEGVRAFATSATPFRRWSPSSNQTRTASTRPKRCLRRFTANTASRSLMTATSFWRSSRTTSLRSARRATGRSARPHPSRRGSRASVPRT